MTFQLGLQPFEQREGVSCRARKTPDDGAILQLANLFPLGLHDRLAHGYLALPAHHDLPIFPAPHNAGPLPHPPAPPSVLPPPAPSLIPSDHPRLRHTLSPPCHP